MAKFETLEQDIKKMLAGDYSHDGIEFREHTSRNVLTLAKNIATHTLEMASHKPPTPKEAALKYIRMSELGEPCVRKLSYKWYNPVYGLFPYAELPEPYLPVKFTFGDYIEELTLFLASEAGHTVTDRQAEYTIKVPGTDWYAVGHIDAKIDGVVVDVKSAADGSFSKYAREGLTDANDSFGYRWQLDAYADANGTQQRAFLFMNKHDGNLMIIDRTKEELLPIGDRIEYIGRTMEEVQSGVTPLRIATSFTKYGHELRTVCSYCAFKYTCYSGDIVGVIVSGRPKYFVESLLTKEGHAYIKDKAKIAKPPKYA